MSQLNVDTIKKADGTGNLTVPAETGTVVTTASPSLGRRNLIINGAMQVAQRGTSFTGLTNGDGGYKLDRWVWGESGTTSYVCTAEQSSDAPDYFSNSFKVTCTTGAAIDSGNMARIFTSLEGQDLQQAGYGTSSAKTMTLSFWVKSNQTGVMIAWFYEPNGGRDYTSQVTINSADTWEYKTVTITGDTANSIANTNGIGLFVEFVYAAGTNFTSGSGALDTWDTYDGASRARGITLDVGATTGDYIAITGVQLEVGDTATPFEHRSYGEELALCQRYYQTYAEDVWAVVGGSRYSTNTVFLSFPLSCPLRAIPTVAGTMYIRRFDNGDEAPSASPNTVFTTAPAFSNAVSTVWNCPFNPGGGLFYFGYMTDTTKVTFDAEL